MYTLKSIIAVAFMVLTIAGSSTLAFGKDCLYVGGTANARALSETEFAFAATGDFDGGGYALIAKSEKINDKQSKNELRHYFATKDGSYIFTQDQNVLTHLSDKRFYGETTYNVVDSGGQFEGMRGSFNSQGVFDFAAGTVVVRFEGKICR